MGIEWTESGKSVGRECAESGQRMCREWRVSLIWPYAVEMMWFIYNNNHTEGPVFSQMTGLIMPMYHV